MSGASWRPRVGERVRVRLPGDRVCDQAPHFPEEADRLGQVVRRRPSGTMRSHAYLVLLDPAPTGDALTGRRASVAACHYAADELEPIRLNTPPHA
jgi:hypothetical protein